MRGDDQRNSKAEKFSEIKINFAKKSIEQNTAAEKMFNYFIIYNKNHIFFNYEIWNFNTP